MWSDMLKRAGNRDGKHARYADVSIEWTRDAFLEWAIPRIESLWTRFPGQSPSIDRINSYGNYSPANCRIITWDYHRTLKNKRRSRYEARKAQTLGVPSLPSLKRSVDNPIHTGLVSVADVPWFYQI